MLKMSQMSFRYLISRNSTYTLLLIRNFKSKALNKKALLCLHSQRTLLP